MAQLIQMRQRIKAIETIKKITHAMRLISMSMHSRIKNKSPYSKRYNCEIECMFRRLRTLSPKWENEITCPNTPTESNPLFILVGSQKGLCGTFNASLFKEFEHLLPKEQLENINFITVGKKAVDYLKEKNVKSIVYEFSDINMRNITQVSNKIIEIIVNSEIHYSSVKILGNELKTFFFQQPKLIQLIPLEKSLEVNSDNISNKIKSSKKENDQIKSESFSGLKNLKMASEIDYAFEQKVEDILDKLAPQYISSNINSILLESLLSEQAARFVSMDSATRNAEKLLDETTIAYNKLRQAKITKELTELSSNFD